MSKNYTVAIIGGGASGLVSGLILAKKGYGKDTVILEKCDRVGKKLAVTGNGQGNLFNYDLTSSHYHAKKGFVDYAINKYGVKEYVDFLRSVGIVTVNEDGKAYPLSKQANSVVDMYRSCLFEKGVEVLTSSEVKRIEKQGDKYLVFVNGEQITADYVIFACGGKAGKQFGTDGTQYDLLANFGHKTTKLYPSLVQLKCDNKDYRILDGIKCEVRLTLNGTSYDGDLLFTKYGISGSAVFYLSAYLNNDGRDIVFADFLPKYSEEEVFDMLSEKKKNMPWLSLRELFIGIINKKVGEVIAKISGNDLKTAVRTLKNFKNDVTGTLGFDYAQVTRGGFITDCIDGKTMQSTLSENLYIIGEALDVDGDCGGYNLQWAFSSASLAVNCIIHK